MTEAIPLWAVVVDYLFGVVMWTLIARFGMRLFLPEESKFFFSQFFIKVTNPLLKLFDPITPSFPDAATGSFVCGMVLFYDTLLPDALAARLLGHGHAVISAGE